MSIEALNSAARAAGFAMAAPEAPEDEVPQSSAWRSEAVLSHQAETPAAPQTPARLPISLGEWVKGVFTSGRRAPA